MSLEVRKNFENHLFALARRIEGERVTYNDIEVVEGVYKSLFFRLKTFFLSVLLCS